MPKKEGRLTKWWYGILRKHTQTPVESVAFTWNEWTSEERKKLLDEYPVSSPMYFGMPVRETKEKIIHKYWDEMTEDEQRMIYGMYGVWIKKQPVE